MKQQTIIIIDEHPVVREGLLHILSSQPDLSVAAESGRSRDLPDLVKRYSPNIAVIDIAMDGIDFTIVKKLKKLCPEIKVVFFTAAYSEEIVKQSQRAGADGFIAKEEGRHTICRALRTVGQDRDYFSAAALEPKPTTITDPKGRTVPTQHPLSLREVDVLCLVAQAKSAKEIAEALEISVKTVDRHKANIMDKLSIRSQTELARYAYRNGFIDA